MIQHGSRDNREDVGKRQGSNCRACKRDECDLDQDVLLESDALHRVRENTTMLVILLAQLHYADQQEPDVPPHAEEDNVVIRHDADVAHNASEHRHRTEDVEDSCGGEPPLLAVEQQ